ncbi:hypothetical protein [Kitasatospora cheerisanensis]|uniref:Uncharacterized protein n=1 Tax=Kitasatospora cheerisanensis KCTC 2395 TaxID=1348663 RepID=A0A066ZD28_9ACTN|nr:hypothetical protein [Kitasatospora cheerisanensis]KDN88216.1 hypothetical protein KCH_00660 [Kitasatospora cheerisanensis KCTC 2395]
MGDSTWLIAAITGATAVAASWTTGRLSARSARQTAELNAAEHRSEQTRQARRTAYLEFIACVHAMGNLNGNALSLFRGPTRPEWRSALQDIHNRLRDNYHDRFLPALDVVCVEGPDEVAAAAMAVGPASTTVFKLIEAILRGDGDPAELPGRCAQLWTAVAAFIRTARHTLNT